MRNALVFGGAAVVLAGGLGLIAKSRKDPDVGPHALDAIPSGALLVASADLAALRASPVGAPFLREGREIPGLGKVRDVCGFDPLDQLTEAALAVPAAGETGEFGLVAAGPIDDEALVKCASKVIEARGGQPVVTTVGGFRTVRDSTLALSGGEIAVKKGGPLLLGAGVYLRAMIDTAEHRAPSIRSSRAHTLLAEQVAGSVLRVTVVLSPDLRKTLAEELEAGGAADSPASSVRAGAFGLSLGPAVGLHAVVSCDDPAACGRLARTLDEKRAARAADLATRLVGFGAVLADLKIEQQNELIHARVNVPADQAAVLADRLLTLRGMRHPMPKDDPSAAPRALPPPRPDEVVKASGDAGAPDAGKR
jgi:hypothetical protein